MALSVNRQIEGYPSDVMGHRDPAGMIRPRSTVPIRARGHEPQNQAGHMTASDRYPSPNFALANRGPSTHDILG